MDYKIQPILLKVIRGIIDERKSKNIVPAFAIEQEVLTRMTRLTLSALDILEKDRVIGSHPSLNKNKLYFINDKNGKDLIKALAEKGGKL